MTGAAQYLLVLYRAERDSGTPVSPGHVADAVGRSPSATTEMLQRLQRRGLVTHEPYEGASLTADGRERAEELYGTYRTLARFFDEVLDIDEYEREAMALTGAISPDVIDRLAATLLDESDVSEVQPLRDGGSASDP